MYAHLGAHISHAHQPILLSHSCARLICCTVNQRKKGEKVTASGRKKYVHPQRPLSVYITRAPLPKVLDFYVHTVALFPSPPAYHILQNTCRLFVFFFFFFFCPFSLFFLWSGLFCCVLVHFTCFTFDELQLFGLLCFTVCDHIIYITLDNRSPRCGLVVTLEYY